MLLDFSRALARVEASTPTSVRSDRSDTTAETTEGVDFASESTVPCELPIENTDEALQQRWSAVKSARSSLYFSTASSSQTKYELFADMATWEVVSNHYGRSLLPSGGSFLSAVYNGLQLDQEKEPPFHIAHLKGWLGVALVHFRELLLQEFEYYFSTLTAVHNFAQFARGVMDGKFGSELVVATALSLSLGASFTIMRECDDRIWEYRVLSHTQSPQDVDFLIVADPVTKTFRPSIKFRLDDYAPVLTGVAFSVSDDPSYDWAADAHRDQLPDSTWCREGKLLVEGKEGYEVVSVRGLKKRFIELQAANKELKSEVTRQALFNTNAKKERDEQIEKVLELESTVQNLKTQLSKSEAQVEVLQTPQKVPSTPQIALASVSKVQQDLKDLERRVVHLEASSKGWRDDGDSFSGSGLEDRVAKLEQASVGGLDEEDRELLSKLKDKELSQVVLDVLSSKSKVVIKKAGVQEEIRRLFNEQKEDFQKEVAEVRRTELSKARSEIKVTAGSARSTPSVKSEGGSGSSKVVGEVKVSGKAAEGSESKAPTCYGCGRTFATNAALGGHVGKCVEARAKRGKSQTGPLKKKRKASTDSTAADEDSDSGGIAFECSFEGCSNVYTKSQKGLFEAHVKSCTHDPEWMGYFYCIYIGCLQVVGSSGSKKCRSYCRTIEEAREHYPSVHKGSKAPKDEKIMAFRRKPEFAPTEREGFTMPQ